MYIRIVLKFFEKYKCKKKKMFRYCLFLQSSRHVSNEQSCLKITGLYHDLLLLTSLLHFFYFIFRAPISLFHFSISSFFLKFFLKSLSSVVEKLFYTYIYINMHNVYILENL